MSKDMAGKMESILDTWKSTGGSLLAFSKNSEIRYTKLCYWNRRLNGPTRKRRAKKEGPDLIPVRITTDKSIAQQSAAFEVSFSNDIKLAVSNGFNADEARRLIEVIRSC